MSGGKYSIGSTGTIGSFYVQHTDAPRPLISVSYYYLVEYPSYVSPFLHFLSGARRLHGASWCFLYSKPKSSFHDIHLRDATRDGPRSIFQLSPHRVWCLGHFLLNVIFLRVVLDLIGKLGNLSRFKLLSAMERATADLRRFPTVFCGVRTTMDFNLRSRALSMTACSN